MGQAAVKDSTAQGVAKVRHYESLHEPSKRLYDDPYAYAMYPGSFVQAWLGERRTHWLYGAVGVGGLLEMISVRTKWLDDEIMKTTLAQQLVILGAGYDTRGYRLGLPQQDVFEVDQPDVQAKKVRLMTSLAKSDVVVADRMALVKFVPVDFTKDSIDEKLKDANGYSLDKPTVVTLEGVTQYIPKESTADTLTKLRNILGPGSKLLITYVDQNVFYDSSKCGPPRVVEKIVSMVSKSGEPWISAWNADGFKSFMDEMGYQVLSDTTLSDYNDKYMVPLGRGLKAEEMLSLERFVVATIKD